MKVAIVFAPTLAATFAFAFCSANTDSVGTYEDGLRGRLYDTGRVLKTKKTRTKKKNDAKTPLDPKSVSKYVTDLWIPGVLYDDEKEGDKMPFDISVRQIQQQMLPLPYSKTTLFAYGRPDDPKSFHYPTSTMEVTKDKQTTVKWINELVKNPVACREEKKSGGVKGKKSTACNFLAPLVGNEQTYHWANPPQNCSDGTVETDCMGPEGLPLYAGPVPTVPHVHGAHVPPESDGFAESWWLPHSNNIPKGYAGTGSWYQGPKSPNSVGRRKVLTTSTSPSSTDNPGYSILRYPNDQSTTSLWFHDHSLGMTLQNVYSIGYGNWIIRKEDNSEEGLDENDCKGELQKLPGPPPLLGQDPNNDLSVRCKIREIPLAFQVRSFYEDGSIHLRKGFVDYELEMMTVNGNTWPKLHVAKDRYRFRLVNAGVLREILGLYMTYRNSDGVENELPFHVIGSDQGLLPKVAVVYRKSATVFKDCGNTGEDLPIKRGLTISPGERYDVIVDFSDLLAGTTVYMKSDNYLDDLPDTLPPGFLPDEVMSFIVTEDLCGHHSGVSSTAPADLKLKPREDIGGVTNPTPRDLAISFDKFPPFQVYMGIDARNSGDNTTKKKLWSDPITENPAIDSIEVWEYWNFMPIAHPMHVHLVKFEIIERCALPAYPKEYPYLDALKNCYGPYPWETGFKDVIKCEANEVCRIKMKFDGSGVYMHHCHFLKHEDDQLMRPICVGAKGVDCPSEFFEHE